MFYQYGADFAENSVKTIAGRVVGQETLGQLDAFGCRQLDRVSLSLSLSLPAFIVSPPFSFRGEFVQSRPLNLPWICFI
jgi:hypothetical protein